MSISFILDYIFYYKQQECASERCLSPPLLSYEIVSTLSSWLYFLDQNIQHGILSLTIFQVAESLSQPIRAYALFTLIPLARIADTPERGSHSLYCPILFRQFDTFFVQKSPITKLMFNWVKSSYSEEPMIQATCRRPSCYSNRRTYFPNHINVVL